MNTFTSAISMYCYLSVLVWVVVCSSPYMRACCRESIIHCAHCQD